MDSCSCRPLCAALHPSLLVFLLFLFVSSVCCYVESGMPMTGGIMATDGFQNSAKVEELARFAVDEHNKKENKLLEFGRVVMAKEQVVAGTLHYLTVEAIDAGKKKIYEAKVWVKPWMNFQELQEFNHVDGAETSSH